MTPRGIGVLGAALAFIGMACFAGLGAEWIGYWGGSAGLPEGIARYPGSEDYSPGRWVSGPVRVAFIDTPVHSWTSTEKAVVQAAIEAWNEALRRAEEDVPGDRRQPLRLELVADAAFPHDLDVDADIRVRWESPSTFFRNWGDPDGDGIPFSAALCAALFLPHRVVPFLGNPCSDLAAAGVRIGPGTIVLNRQSLAGWYVDPDPYTDQHFEPVSVRLCGRQHTSLRAVRGTPAAGRHDLRTVVLHELGHALGLVHSGGCDGDLFTGGAPDDDGRLMWEGYLRDRRTLESHLPLGERRHVTEADVAALRLQMPAAAIAWSQETGHDGVCELYYAYAEHLLRTAHYSEAILWFQTFLDACPGSDLVGQAEEGIIRAEVALIADLPASERTMMPAPHGVLVPGLGNPTVEVLNDTPYVLTVRYVGPVAKSMTLAPGLSDTFVLLPGVYQVTATVDAPILPFYGAFALLPDRQYVSRFFVRTAPTP